MRLAAIPIFLASVALAGCGGGGGGAAPALDLNGWWELSVIEPGATNWRDVAIHPLVHEGGQVDAVGIVFSLEGSTLRGADPDWTDEWRTEYELTAVTNDYVEGVAIAYAPGESPMSVPMRLVRVPAPNGLVTLDGVVMGEPVSVTSSTAYGAATIVTDPGSEEYRIALVDFHPEHALVFSVRFEALPPLAARTYDIGADPVPTGAVFILETTGGAAATGSISFVRLDGDRVTGSYAFELAGGGAVSGSFDVPILYTEVNPH